MTIRILISSPHRDTSVLKDLLAEALAKEESVLDPVDAEPLADALANHHLKNNIHFDEIVDFIPEGLAKCKAAFQASDESIYPALDPERHYMMNKVSKLHGVDKLITHTTEEMGELPVPSVAWPAARRAPTGSLLTRPSMFSLNLLMLMMLLRDDLEIDAFVSAEIPKTVDRTYGRNFERPDLKTLDFAEAEARVIGDRLSKLTDNQRQFVADAEEQGLEVDLFFTGGRGMYGETCPAVRVFSEAEFSTRANYFSTLWERGASSTQLLAAKPHAQGQRALPLLPSALHRPQPRRDPGSIRAHTSTTSTSVRP